MNERASQRGYNLIELLIAIALLGVVLLSILSLFIWGRKNVYSGKQMTTAISIGTRVLEDLAPLTKEEIYEGAFGIADDATGSEIKLNGVTYKNAALRSTKAKILASYNATQTENANGPKFVTTKWAEQLVEKLPNGATRPRLDDGAVTIIMMPRADEDPNAPKFGTAAVMQIRVIVSWLEQRRHREVILETVKAQ